MRKNWKLAILFLALQPCSINYIHAQSNSNETDDETLDTVIVNRANFRSLTEGTGSYIIDDISSATGLTLTARETPQSVSIITNQKLKDQASSNIADALKNTTGINVLRESGMYRFQSRGFYMDQIQEDGVNSYAPGARINAYRDAGDYSDLAIYDHIEVLRGPTGLMQGTGEPGGTINLVRKRTKDEFSATNTFSVGNWSKIQETIDITGPLNADKSLRGRFVGNFDKAGSFKDNIDHKNGMIFGVIEGDIGNNTTWQLGGLFQKRNEVPDFYGVPMTRDGKDAGLSRSTYLGAKWNRLEKQKTNGFFEIDHEFSSDWKLNASANYNQFKSHNTFSALIAKNGLGVDRLASVNDAIRYDNDGQQFSTQIKLTGGFELFNRKQEIFGGIDYSYNDYDSHMRVVPNSTKYNIDNFTGNEIIEPNWSNNSILYTDVKFNTKYKETAGRFGGRFNFIDGLYAIIGTRATNYQYDSTSKYYRYRGNPDDDIIRDHYEKTKFIPYYGLNYNLNDNATLYASYTEIFRPQSALDKNDNFLPPVTGTNKEIGIKSTFFDGRVDASFALFEIIQANRAIYNNIERYYYADGKVQSRGLDIELTGEITKGWNVFTGYTYNRSKYLESESTSIIAGDNYSPATPQHMFRLNTTYVLPVDNDKWKIGGGVRAQSKTKSVYNIEQKAYAVWDLSLQYNFKENIYLQINANNIFDKRYYENNRVRDKTFNNYFADPRSILVTFNTTF